LVAAKPWTDMFQEFIHAHHEIWDRATHKQLQEDLVNHMWIHAGGNPAVNPGNKPVWFDAMLIYLIVNYLYLVDFKKLFVFIWL
jgi:hypothetical protein